MAIGRGRLAASVAVAVVVLVLGGGYLLVNTARFHGWIESRISAAIGPQVRFASARPSLLPEPGLVLYDVSIASPIDDQATTARSIRATAQLLPLLKGDLELSSIELEQPDVHVQLEQDGLPTAVGAVGLFLTATLPDQIHEKRRVPDVELSNGEVHVTGPVVPGGAAVTISGLDLRFTAVGEGTALQVKGSATAKEVTLADLDASGLATDFDVKTGALALSNTRFAAYDGQWQAQGTFSFENKLRFDGRIDAQDVDAKKILADVTGGATKASFDTLEVHTSVSVEAGEEWERSAQGTGRVVLRGGTVQSSSILLAIWHALIPKLGPLDPLKGMNPPSPSTRLDRLEMNFELSDGRVKTNDLVLVSSDYTLEARGSIAFDGALDLRGQVRFTSQGLEKLVMMASLPASGSGKADLPPISTRITGTLRDPQVRPDVSAIPTAPVKALFAGAKDGAQAVGRAVKGTFESGVRALERMAD